MSNIIEFVKSQERLFIPAISESSVLWEQECQFAIQAFQKNDYLAKMALSNQTSAQNAIINVAAIGITLNPASKLAYLVPREGGICLDISYMGLIHLAAESGSIRWVQCEIVYSNDKFRRQGPGLRPIHEIDDFGDRGEPVGAYSIAKTSDGDYLIEVMRKDEIEAIRNDSPAWRAFVSKGKSCPWSTHTLEMWRKTVIKRAYKYWPKVERLDRAIDYLNTDGGEGIEMEPVLAHVPQELIDANTAAIEKALADEVQEFVDKMGLAQSTGELQGAFAAAYRKTKGHDKMQRQVQEIYAKNKARLESEK